MNNTETDDKHLTLTKLYKDFRGYTFPVGGKSCEDIDIDIYEYAGYINGLVKSYLDGVVIEVKDINPNNINEIETKLAGCAIKVSELRKVWKIQRELTELLIECVKSDSN